MQERYIPKFKENQKESSGMESPLPLKEFFHPDDSLVHGLTWQELIDAVYSNTPREKINDKVVMKQFEDIMKSQMNDARKELKGSMDAVIDSIIQ